MPWANFQDPISQKRWGFVLKPYIKNHKGINGDKSKELLNSKFRKGGIGMAQEKKYDWIFATNLKLKKAAAYVKLYKKRWTIETIYRVTDKIRIYTTSTNSVIRYFLFMFTCFVYNIWRFLQLFLGEDFTLANHKTNMIIYMAKHGLIYPLHYDKFEMIANEFFNSWCFLIIGQKNADTSHLWDLDRPLTPKKETTTKDQSKKIFSST